MEFDFQANLFAALLFPDTTILDDLVDQTWTRLQQVLAVREPVALKVKSAGKEYVCMPINRLVNRSI